VLAHLAEVSIRSLLLALAAAIVPWILRRRREAALQHAVWTAVVCGMLALFAFGEVLPRLPLRIPTSNADAIPTSTSTVEDQPPLTDASQVSVSVPEPPHHPIDWRVVALYAYGAIALAFLSRLVAGLFLVRRLFATARSVSRGVFESEVVTVPVTVGWLRPRIVLPLEWREWDREKLDAVLTHESTHVRRRDGLAAALAHVNRCIFWFHPLAWALERKLALLAEQACDESSVATLGDLDRYANLLLEMATAVDGTQGRLRGHALTMAAGSHVRQRIDSLLREGRSFSRGLTWTGWISVMLCGIPILLFAGAVEPDRQPPLLRLEMPHLSWPVPPIPELRLARNRSAPPASATAAQTPRVQAPIPPSPKFEVASIKPNPGCVQPRPGPMPRGRLTLPCLTVRNMIQVSYGTNGAVRNPRIQIVDGPPWYASDKYDLVAKAEDGNASLEQMFGPMLRSLLEDRFGLKTHRENRDMPVYTLTVAKNGPKIQPTKEGSCDPAFDMSRYGLPPEPGQTVIPPCGRGGNRVNGSTRIIDGWGANIADFMHASIFMYLDRPVIDKTGLTGMFDYHLEFSIDTVQPGAACSTDCPGSADPSGPSIFTAFQDQLGLKLTADTGPVEVLVIDHIERPSDN